DGNIVKLRNFSIVNGGQTTYQIHKSDDINKQNSFWLTCKIIRNTGKTDDERNSFSLAIAQAANSQKPIQPADLKANSPEQHLFAQAMREIGVFYRNKRGDDIPKKYSLAYLNTNLAKVGSFCMAAIFQEPCKSRNKPSESYNADNVPNYYNTIFTSNPKQVAKICRELLYVNYYFDKIFQPKFKADNKTLPDADNRIPFANNARTICIAFTALAARYYQGNITDQSLTMALTSAQSDSSKSDFYKVFRNLGDMQCLLPIKLYTAAYDVALKKLFKTSIKAGTQTYVYVRKHDKTLTARNFLQNDKNYYAILSEHWDTLRDDIHDILSDD
ncbi:MAG: AIPR family protein, partial [Selenomonadaceae bacterium]|nr:AIPR family protein [Selenomonadaceae bacterium]